MTTNDLEAAQSVPAQADELLNADDERAAENFNELCLCFPLDRNIRDLVEYLMLMMFAGCFGFLVGTIIFQGPCRC